MSIAPTSILDTFSRSHSVGWGQADSGAVWKTNSSQFSVSNGEGRYGSVVGSNIRTAYADLSTAGLAPRTQDEVLMKVSWSSGTAWPLTDFGPALSMSSDHQNYYALTIQGNWSELAIIVYIKGRRWELNRTSISITKDTDYWVRFRRNGTLYGKIWKAGTPEPASWTITSGLWDGASAGPGAGHPGLFTRQTRDAYTISVKNLYYYSFIDSYKTGIIKDTFDRDLPDVWGVSDTKHIWEGSATADPFGYRDRFTGGVTTSSTGRAFVTTTDTADKNFIIGPPRTGNVENYTKALIGASGTGAGRLRVGLRGTKAYSNGQLHVLGYMVQLETGSNNLTLYKRTSTSQPWVWLASGTLPFTITENTLYSVRFQANGSGLRARVWAGAAEPTTWNVAGNDTSITTGTLFLGVNSSTTSLRTYYLYETIYDAPAVGEPNQPVVINHTTPGKLNVVSTTDNSMQLFATYTGDENNNCTASVRWRQQGSTTWNTNIVGPLFERSSKRYSFSITGLSRGVNYQIQVTFQDNDGVQGTNPIQEIYKTTATGLQTGTIKLLSIKPNSATIEATYSQDIDRNSAAGLISRKVSQETYKVEDHFSDAKDNLSLQNYLSPRGGRWQRHTVSSLDAQSLFKLNGFFGKTKYNTDKILYYHDAQAPVSAYDVSADLFVAKLNSTTGITARTSPNAETYYGAGVNGETKEWELFKVLNGVKTVLDSVAYTGDTGIVFDVRLVVKDTLKALYVNDKLLLSSSDNTIQDIGYAGYYVTGVEKGGFDNQIILRTFSMTYRSVHSEWKWHTEMTPNRAVTPSKFSGVASGLEPDTQYEFGVRFYESETNLVRNGSCEVNTNGWSAGLSTLARDTTMAYHGRASLKWVITSTSSVQTASYSSVHTDTDRVRVSPGKIISVSGFVHAGTGASGKPIALQVDFRNSSGGLVGSANVGPYTNLTASWQRIKYTGLLVPAGTEYVIIRFRGQTPTSFSINDTIYLDALQVEEGSSVSPYVDGLTQGSSVSGINPLTVQGQTPGRAVSLESIGAKTSPTSAVISVRYLHDTNHNSRVNIQYKSTTENLYRTVSFQKVVPYREMNKFELTLAGLASSTTYQLRVTIEDPDGTLQGTPTTLVGLFTTKGFVAQSDRHEKHYVWKVYSPKNRYLGTIPDAPLPSFSYHENGGVTDLELELHRKFSEMQAERIIAFQNRVDIWAIDPSTNGMGPNLITDPDCDPKIGGWVVNQATGVYGTNSTYRLVDGPDGSSCLRIHSKDGTRVMTPSNPIHVLEEVPLVIECTAKANASKLRLLVQSFDVKDVKLDESDDVAETVGPNWQRLRVNYTPPQNTEYIRVCIQNSDQGYMYADKFTVRAKEMLVYRGNIEAYTPKIDENGETVSVQILGLSAQLSDDYIEFLQFVESQPAKDVEAGRISFGAADPADMMKKIVDEARKSNPHFNLYYTTESIRYTGTLMQYTFRDQQIRNCLDKVRDLCPAGWHYFIEADGLVNLRGPQHADTHVLRIGVEVSSFEVEKSIRNLKNYIRVKGRQDEDKSEVDGFGSIAYVAFDQESIDKFGKRMLLINDSNLADPETAKLVGDGRLEENNKEEQRVQCELLDEKLLKSPTGSLKGYNIEAFKPGDNIIITDPYSGPRYSYWNQMVWDEDQWDSSDDFRPIPEAVPVKTIKYKADRIELELSERPPSQVGDYAKLYKYLAQKDKE